jgi:hypothetical protein
MTKKQKQFDDTDHFPELTTPQYGEKVQSFAIHDAKGNKRIAYVRDEKDGYRYEGKDQKVAKHGR